MTAAQLDDLLDRVVAFDLHERRERETMRPPAAFATEKPRSHRGFGTFAKPPFLTPEQHRALHREHELTVILMREGSTAEIRTRARLRVLELEKAITR